MSHVIWMGLLLGLPLFAQQGTFDLFRFQVPRGYQVQEGKDDYGMQRFANNQFCQIALYRSLPTTGSAEGDFAKEWDLVKGRFKVLSENPPERGQAEGWTLSNQSAAVESTGTGKFVTTVQVYSGFGVRAAVVMNMNHGGCKDEFQRFLGSLRLEPPKATTSIFNPPPAASSTGWASSAEANPDLGAWPAEFMADYVQFSKHGMRVRIYHAMTITDAMRSRGDMRMNVWNLLVTPQFRASEIHYWDNSPGAQGPYTTGGNFLIANAVENGRQVVVGMNYAAKNGLLYPIVAIAPDQATFQRFAGTPEQMEKLLRLNMFEVPARELNGRWTSNFNSAMEMYSVSTGIYAGVAVASASLDITFENGNYESRSKATFGRIGALTNAKESEAGTYQLNGSMLVLSPQGKPRDAYLLWFEAVRGGFMLHLVNDQYRGNRWDLLRAK